MRSRRSSRGCLGLGRRFAVAAIGVCALLALSGCGSSGGSSPTTSAASSGTTGSSSNGNDKAAGTTSAAKAAASGGGKPVEAIDPCALLTKGEIGAAFGRSFADGVRDGTQCVINTDAMPLETVSIQVEKRDTVGGIDSEAVSGVGDEAFLYLKGAGITVKAGKVQVVIFVSANTGGRTVVPKATLIDWGRLAISRV
jgi:hypothetical protein